MLHSLWESVWQVLIKLNILLPYNLAIILFSIYSKESKTYLYKKIYTWICTAALFIIAKTLKQLRCPSVGEQKTVVHPDNGVLFGTKKEMGYQAIQDTKKS